MYNAVLSGKPPHTDFNRAQMRHMAACPLELRVIQQSEDFMDLKAYHHALNQGFSERDATRIGDDAFEDARFMNRQRQEPDYAAQQEQQYFEEMEREQNRVKQIPIAFIDEKGAIVIVGAENFKKASFVDSDRAFPAAWKRLIIEP